MTETFAKYWKFFDIGVQNTFVYRWNFLLRSIFGELINGVPASSPGRLKRIDGSVPAPRQKQDCGACVPA